MKNSPTLHFEFHPNETPELKAAGYGVGMLSLNGAPYWYAGSPNKAKGIDWTWVDFLEYLGSSWAALVAEQAYPFDWLNELVTHPGEILPVAEERWSRLGEDVAEKEEPALLKFHREHNLSSGWKGISLPYLYFLRVGNTVWLSPENGSPIRANYKECIDSLETLGNKIADSFDESENPRVRLAIARWNSRVSSLRNSLVRLATGYSEQELETIECGQSQDFFWDLENINAANDNEYLAAARMGRGIFEPKAIAHIFEKMRAAQKVFTPELDRLSVEAIAFLRSGEFKYPHEAGRELAYWLRKNLNVSVESLFDINGFLETLGVSLQSANLSSPHVDAIAFWGARGPCILLNKDRSYLAESRTRMTLAHELCHLIIDRHSALPAAEVFGGNVDSYVERRANAFAAELLMPREAVISRVSRLGTTLKESLVDLCDYYQIGKTAACAQIFNSQAFDALSYSERKYIADRIHRIDNVLVTSPSILSSVI